MNRRKKIDELNHSLLVISAEKDREQDDGMKRYYNGVEVGLKIAIEKLEGKTDQTVFEYITSSVENMAEFIISNPCKNNKSYDCEEGVSCNECMKNYLLSKKV